ncbi:MAG: tyrosine-type recombinase/integrase [Pseudobdellovibrionaceae bacterium]
MKIWSYSQSHRIDGAGKLVEQANKFFEVCEVHGNSMDSVRTYVFGLMRFFRWIGGDWDRFEKFTQKDLQDWMAAMKKQGLKPNSINQRLNCARVFYRFCFNNSIPRAPGVLYPKGYYRNRRYFSYGDNAGRRPDRELYVKVPKPVMNPMTPSEVNRFMAHLKRYRDIAIVLAMLSCGLRSMEVIGLKFEDVDFNRCQIRVSGKRRKERMVPMSFPIMRAFEKYLTFERPANSKNRFFVILRGKDAGKPLNRETFRAFFRYHRKKSGVMAAHPHEFRHVFASDLARSGVQAQVIQELLGHAEIKTTEIYIDLNIDDVRAEYDRAMKRIEERYAAIQTKTTPT